MLVMNLEGLEGAGDEPEGLKEDGDKPGEPGEAGVELEGLKEAVNTRGAALIPALAWAQPKYSLGEDTFKTMIIVHFTNSL